MSKASELNDQDFAAYIAEETRLGAEWRATLDSARVAGRAAFAAGLPISANPHPHPTAEGGALIWNAWREGYCEAAPEWSEDD
jgi:hypothetical protein